MTKFTEIYKKIWQDHADVLNSFKKIHDKFQQDRATYQEEFNRQGKPVMELLREYEDRLCSGMERGQFGKYSDKVAEKFWQRVKKDFPLIELVGVEIIRT